MTRIKYTVSTFTNALGTWRARVDFSERLAENASNPDYNVLRKLPYIRKIARNAIVRELVEREQKTNETEEQAEQRMREYLKLETVEVGLTPFNTWSHIILGEA